MRKCFVAIGGGNVQQKETLSIDQKIIELSGKSNPKVLFFPTASRDDQGYGKRFKQYYRSLGCEVDAIRLLHTLKSHVDFENECFAYDIWYFGGGDTAFLMETIRQMGIDRLIEQAYEQGIVLVGYSAGANMLFSYGYAEQEGNYALVEGIGLCKKVFTPHYQKRPWFKEAVYSISLPSIGCKDQQAYIEEDEKGYFFP